MSRITSFGNQEADSWDWEQELISILREEGVYLNSFTKSIETPFIEVELFGSGIERVSSGLPTQTINIELKYYPQQASNTKKQKDITTKIDAIEKKAGKRAINF